MVLVGIVFVVLGIVSSGLSTASVYLTVAKHPSKEGHHYIAPDPRNCTSGANKCFIELNNLGTKLTSFNSLSISFEKNSDTFLLHTLLAFHNYTQLEIHGAPHGKTTVICINQNNDSLGVGLTFTNVSNFIISNIVFKNCSYRHNHTKDDRIAPTAILFEKCENLQLISVTVQYSTGFGVRMFDVVGNVHIESCVFRNNSIKGIDPGGGGGGMYLEMTSNLDKNGMYRLFKCKFMYNKAHTSQVYFEKNRIRTFGQGGGLLIYFRGDASHHHFRIRDCEFINNTAVWGGGLHIFMTDSSYNNTIVVDHSLIEGNKASAGGGGMVVYLKSQTCISENSISIYRSNFTKNRAKNQGGGTIILSSLSNFNDSCINNLQFQSCNWKYNVASYSGAIDLTTRRTVSEFFPIVPVFTNCTFKCNMVFNSEEGQFGKAAFMVFKSIIKFDKSILFSDNNGTALYAITSRVEFSAKTEAKFVGNRGSNGGAISLTNSYLIIEESAVLNFINNFAYEFGGAIYSVTQGEHELHQNINGLNCFLHCKENVTLLFKRNRANNLNNSEFNFGRAIFATSFLSCMPKRIATLLTSNETNTSVALGTITNFEFIGSNAYDEVVSSAAELLSTESDILQVIPGKEFHVNVITKDNFGHKLQSTYKAFLLGRTPCRNGSITIDPKYTYLPTNKLKLYGDPGTVCNITIKRIGKKVFHKSFKVSIAQCPPGYALTENKHLLSKHSNKECVCAQQPAKGSSTESFRGIPKCDEQSFRAYVLPHYWVGYEPGDASDDNLVTAFCPHSFCSYSASSYANHYLLPGTADKTILDKYICENGRTGTICGKCLNNYSVYFHSPNFLCKKNFLCSVGWIFYLFSEVCTLLVLFAIALYFNISFTSGMLNGFLFYAQIIDILIVPEELQENNYPSWNIMTLKTSIFLYHFFNLDFFHLDALSFCLWEGARTLDIIAMKYLTIVLSFVLVIGVFAFMNFCTFGKLKYFSKRLKLQQSVIHGISTFLVTCFAQTVKVTFLIITPGFVMKRGDKISSYQVLYSGDIQLFGIKHLKYVIPGLILFFSVVVVPTFFLMCYPLGFKALYRCGLSETKITKLHRFLCIIRLRPLFDSFQGCYKDKYRCFAGLYFIYRTAILASYSFSFGATQFYVLVQIQASIILLVHCLSHPYIRKNHNALDTLIFTNIAVINGLSIFIHTKRRQPLYSSTLRVACGIQSILTIFPLISLILYTVVKIFMKVIKGKKNSEEERSVSDLEDIPFHRIDDVCDSVSEKENSVGEQNRIF